MAAAFAEPPLYASAEDKPKRHFLPPVSPTQRGCIGQPGSPLSPKALGAWRADAEALLWEMKAHEGEMGCRASSLMASVQGTTARARLEQALADGEPRGVRKALWHAICVAKLGSDPFVKRAQASLSKFERCARECREGLAEGSLLRLERALAVVSDLGLGPGLYRDPCVAQARDRVAAWSPYAAHLRQLDQDLRAGVRQYCARWVATIDAGLLSPEWEALASAELVKLPGAAEAVEDALHAPELRLLYAAPWRERERLVSMVRGRLVDLQVDTKPLRFRAARSAAERVAVVISGPSELLFQVNQCARGRGEPAALGLRPEAEPPEQREARIRLVLGRLRAAEEAAAAAAAAGQLAARAPAGASEALRPWYASFPPCQPPLPLLDPARLHQTKQSPAGTRGLKGSRSAGSLAAARSPP